MFKENEEFNAACGDFGGECSGEGVRLVSDVDLSCTGKSEVTFLLREGLFSKSTFGSCVGVSKSCSFVRLTIGVAVRIFRGRALGLNVDFGALC